MTEVEASIALNLLPGIGPIRIRALLDRFETPQQILSASCVALQEIKGIGRDTADAIAGWEKQIDLAGEIKQIEQFGAKVLHWRSPEYPKNLLTIANPPVVLYVWGDLTSNDDRAIGVVGSRNATHYGTECARKISYQIAFGGYTVVSGLARGIDTAAHQGALAAKGRTIAVIGSGFMELYPPENQGLAEKIATSGAVISEYPMRRVADRQSFPYRNRIISGWSKGLLVIEAGLNSGALITANQALEQGRNIYAIPGQIDRPTSAGSNRLIQQGAKLITSANDILDEFNFLPFPNQATTTLETAANTDQPPKLSHDETLIYTALQSGDLTLDEISAATRLPVSKVNSVTLILEMKRLIKILPGQRLTLWTES